MKCHSIAHYKPETISAIKRIRSKITIHIRKRLRGIKTRSTIDAILNGHIENVFLIYDHPFDANMVEVCVRDEDSLVESIVQSNVRHNMQQKPFDASYIKEGFRMYRESSHDLSTPRSRSWDDSQDDSQYASQDDSQYASQDDSQYASQDDSQYDSQDDSQDASQCDSQYSPRNVIDRSRNKSAAVPNFFLPDITYPDDSVKLFGTTLVWYNNRCKYVKCLPKYFIPSKSPRLIAKVSSDTQTLLKRDGDLYLFDGNDGYITTKYHGVIIKSLCGALNLRCTGVRRDNMITLENFFDAM